MKREYNKIKTVEVDVHDEEEVIEDPTSDRPKLKAVVKEPAKKHKKGVVERLVVNFIGPDGIQNVGHKIQQEIIVPALKNIVVDSLSGLGDAIGHGVQSALFGRDNVQSGRTYRNTSNYSGNTNKYWSNPGAGYSSNRPSRTGYGHPVDVEEVPHSAGTDYLIATRGEAIDILTGLKEQLQEYGTARLSDYYDLVGIVSTNYTNNEWGWTDLSTARIQAVRNGYIIKLPRMEAL